MNYENKIIKKITDAIEEIMKFAVKKLVELVKNK